MIIKNKNGVKQLAISSFFFECMKMCHYFLWRNKIYFHFYHSLNNRSYFRIEGTILLIFFLGVGLAKLSS